MHSIDTHEHIKGKIAMLRCDVDLCSSTKDIVAGCLPRLSIGSVLVFDDYGFFSCEGITDFCDEFRAQPDFLLIHNLMGHAVFLKIAKETLI